MKLYELKQADKQKDKGTKRRKHRNTFKQIKKRTIQIEKYELYHPVTPPITLYHPAGRRHPV